MGHPYRTIILPCLSAKMRQAGATNESLAEAAGICSRTVNQARMLKPVQIRLGLFMMEALNTRTFKRDRRGAK